MEEDKDISIRPSENIVIVIIIIVIIIALRELESAICGWSNGVLRADYNSRFYPNYLADNSQLFWIIPAWNFAQIT